MFPVTPEKERALLERMKLLEVSEITLVERYTTGSGKGGQKRNKTQSCVQLTHLPSGIEVRCDSSRSQAMNRFLARRILCDKLEELLKGQRSKASMEISKIRRQKARRARKTKVKMLEDKRQKSQRLKNRKVNFD